MRTYIQTRGKTADYAFIGGAPSERWWLAFRDATSFEKPTIIVDGDQSNWRCFLSGIPSQRKDRVGTTVRFTIVLEGQCGERTSDDALKLISAWLQDAAQAGLGNRVKTSLDRAFEEAKVEQLLSTRGDNSVARDEVKRNIENALASLDPSKTIKEREKAESWVGSVASNSAQESFMARSLLLLNGKRKGTTALFNLLGTIEDFSKFAKQYQSVAVLIDDSDKSIGTAVVPIEKKKPPMPLPTNPKPKPTIWLRVGVGIAITAIVIWILIPKARADHRPSQIPMEKQ